MGPPPTKTPAFTAGLFFYLRAAGSVGPASIPVRKNICLKYKYASRKYVLRLYCCLLRHGSYRDWAEVSVSVYRPVQSAPTCASRQASCTNPRSGISLRRISMFSRSAINPASLCRFAEEIYFLSAEQAAPPPPPRHASDSGFTRLPALLWER